MRILIGSAGRRAYLVRWFKEAVGRLGVDGQVLVTDCSSDVAATIFADRSLQAPRFDDPDYADFMRRTFDEVQPDLFFTLNDYEADAMAGGLADELVGHGCVIVNLSAANQAVVADKLLMSKTLRAAGILTPVTVGGDDTEGIKSLTDQYQELVVKDRLGSGSSGLQFLTSSEVGEALTREGLIGRGVGSVVQPRVSGDEFGVDAVSSLTGAAQTHAVLCRRKLAMRSGETNKARTESPEPFESIAASVAQLLEARGLIDMDFLVGDDGAPIVIDINPRFGGGYPFNHVAGADVPAFYIASVLGVAPPEGWWDYTPGLVAAKFDDIAVTAGNA